jgi:antitoxin MazE
MEGNVMGNSLKTRIVRIGNSQGIRIPKIILKQVELSDEIEIEVQGDQLIVRSIRGPRQGWDEKFAQMANRSDDRLLDSEVTSLSKWDKDEWEW